MIISNDYETFGMHSAAERYLWTTYHLFVIISSLIGDSLILLATSQRNAVKLHRFIVTMMQHIAISDLSISLLHILPAAISLIAGHWVLGESLCFAKPYVAYWIYPSGMCLICALITSKFLILRFPMRARGWNEKQAHIVCGTIWASGLAYPLLFYLIDPRDVFFDYRTYGCDYHFQAEVWKKIQPITFTITALAPNLIIIGTSIPVLIIARNAARARQSSVNLRGVVTVVVTAAVYLISTLPGTVYFLAASHVGPDSLIHFHLYRIGIFMGMINVMSNFFIYSLTIESFRDFWVKKLHLPFGKNSNIISPELERGTKTTNSVPEE